MWIGPFDALGLILLPIVSAWRRGNHDRPNRVSARKNTLLANPAAVALSSLFAVGLVFLIVDQWPCFMGVPNCD